MINNVEACMIYEDRDILVLHKPAGIAVQNAHIGAMDLEHMLLNYLGGQGGRQMPYVGIVHRLDQPVEGVLVFGKTPKATAALNRQIQQQKMEKRYLAVVQGVPQEKAGTLTDYLRKEKRENRSVVVPKGTPEGKKAVLDYRILAVEEGNALLEIHLHTGRHHQIRVQLSHLGFPIVGDGKYGGHMGKSLALCAYKLGFLHPTIGDCKEFKIRPESEPFLLYKKDFLNFL